MADICAATWMWYVTMQSFIWMMMLKLTITILKSANYVQNSDLTNVHWQRFHIDLIICVRSLISLKEQFVLLANEHIFFCQFNASVMLMLMHRDVVYLHGLVIICEVNIKYAWNFIYFFVLKICSTNITLDAIHSALFHYFTNATLMVISNQQFWAFKNIPRYILTVECYTQFQVSNTEIHLIAS